MDPDGPAIQAVVKWCRSGFDGHRSALNEALWVIEQSAKGFDWPLTWEASVLMACIDGFEKTGSPHLIDLFLYVHSDSHINVSLVALDLAHRAAIIRRNRDGLYPSQKKGFEYLRRTLAMRLTERLCEGGASLGDASRLAASYIVSSRGSLGPLKASTVEKWCEGLPTRLARGNLSDERKERGREVLLLLRDGVSDLAARDTGERR